LAIIIRTMPERIRARKTQVLRANQLVNLGFCKKAAFDMVKIITIKFRTLSAKSNQLNTVAV
jgi:hypothetical protein